MTKKALSNLCHLARMHACVTNLAGRTEGDVEMGETVTGEGDEGPGEDPVKNAKNEFREILQTVFSKREVDRVMPRIESWKGRM